MTTYRYDANGNELGNDAGLSLGYNVANQTTTLTSVGQQAKSLGYLDSGQDELVTDGSATLTDSQLGVGNRTDGSGSSYYTRDNAGGLLGERTPSGTYYYVTDALGSIIALTNSSGAVANSYKYDPYGATLSSSGTAPNVWGYAGGYQTGGLYHFGQRYYDPTSARWTQQDPLNQFDDLREGNRFLYTGDDPVNLTDASGECPVCLVVVGVGVRLAARQVARRVAPIVYRYATRPLVRAGASVQTRRTEPLTHVVTHFARHLLGL